MTWLKNYFYVTFWRPLFAPSLLAMFHQRYRDRTITAISDTHGAHRRLQIPDTDILIHCGDACTDGDDAQLTDFFRWFAAQPARYKLFISGNHDLPFELEPDGALALVPPGVRYLDNKTIQIEGIVFQSLPARPWLHGLPEIKGKVDFLLTHGPAQGVLDAGLGCPKLRGYVAALQPAFHLFGHIHETAAQSLQNGKTHFQNVIPAEISR